MFPGVEGALSSSVATLIALALPILVLVGIIAVASGIRWVGFWLERREQRRRN